eukprot:scaffold92701_cov26-Tisochrysis_lutea.AAC.1
MRQAYALYSLSERTLRAANHTLIPAITPSTSTSTIFANTRRLGLGVKQSLRQAEVMSVRLMEHSLDPTPLPPQGQACQMANANARQLAPRARA